MQRVAAFCVSVAIFLIFIASQIFWLRRLRRGSERLVSSPGGRRAVARAGLAVYLLLWIYNFPGIRHGTSPTHLTLGAALLQAPFEWWVLSSLLGFIVAGLLGMLDRIVSRAHGIFRKVTARQPAGPPRLLSPNRRRFLERTALAASAFPFVADAYGLFYGRLNLETTRQRIRLGRLPKAFDGFRIAQLSDIHIGPFMSAEEIRKYAAITNDLRPDLVVLTGDFVTWDATTQQAAVEALAGLKAPFGVFGCLGNHEMWTDTENTITSLFASAGTRILRHQAATIQSGGEKINLIGVDFQTRTRLGSHAEGFVRTYLQGVERLIAPATVNLLLSHNPNTFDRAAALGIDLSLAGHTHGGQVSLEFIHPSLTPSRLITRYVHGWFEKDGAQLYVNRGIGTIAVPIRLNAPPEITLFELARA